MFIFFKIKWYKNQLSSTQKPWSIYFENTGNMEKLVIGRYESSNFIDFHEFFFI